MSIGSSSQEDGTPLRLGSMGVRAERSHHPNRRARTGRPRTTQRRFEGLRPPIAGAEGRSGARGGLHGSGPPLEGRSTYHFDLKSDKTTR